MPNRIIKESINESKGLSECSPFAQDMFKRLITYADDYGRFNPDPEIMRARLYPRELESVDESDIDSAVLELCQSDKLRYYRAPSNRGQTVFGLITGWNEHQRVRMSRAKYPDPEEEINDWAVKRFVPVDMKIAIFERDRFTCQQCGANYSMPGVPVKRAIRLMDGALHVDHIVPVGQGGRASMENLRLLCAGCNKARKKKLTFAELVELSVYAPTCEVSPRLAASRGESRPESNPNPIQSESNPPSAPAAQDEPEEEQVIDSGKPKPPTTVFVERFQDAQGYSVSNWGEAAANAKWMIEQHYTVEDAIACRSYLKTQAFWAEKPVTLAVVRSRIGEWAAAGKPATEKQVAAHSKTNGQGAHRAEKTRQQQDYWDSKARARGLPV